MIQYGSDLDLHSCLQRIFPLEDMLDDECTYWGGMLAMLEMLRRGVTSFADMYMNMDGIARAAERCGVRANLSRGMTNEAGLADALSLHRDWNGACDGRIRVYVAPHAEYTTTPEFIAKTRELAEKLDTGIHTHASETASETEGCLARHGLTPIMCVGEGLDIRKAGQHVTHTLRQVDGGLKGITAEQAETIVIAYEPVWAIGTGEVATPQDAQEVCSAIRARIAELYSPELAAGVRVLYGGSVKGSNTAGIMAMEDVDGALVGGASLDAADFAAVVRYRDHITA